MSERSKKPEINVPVKMVLNLYQEAGGEKDSIKQENIKAIEQSINLHKKVSNYIEKKYKNNDFETKIGFFDAFWIARANPYTFFSEVVTNPSRGKTTMFRAIEKSLNRLFIEEVMKANTGKKHTAEEISKMTIVDLYDKDKTRGIKIDVSKLDPAVADLYKKEGHPVSILQGHSRILSIMGKVDIDGVMHAEPRLKSSVGDASKAKTAVIEETIVSTKQELTDSIILYNILHQKGEVNKEETKFGEYEPFLLNLENCITIRNSGKIDTEAINKSTPKKNANKKRQNSTYLANGDPVKDPSITPPKEEVTNIKKLLAGWSGKSTDLPKLPIKNIDFGTDLDNEIDPESVKAFENEMYQIFKDCNALNSFLKITSAFKSLCAVAKQQGFRPDAPLSMLLHKMMDTLNEAKTLVEELSIFDFEDLRNLMRKNHESPNSLELTNEEKLVLTKLRRVLYSLDPRIFSGWGDSAPNRFLGKIIHFFINDPRGIQDEQTPLKSDFRTKAGFGGSFLVDNFHKEDSDQCFSQNPFDQMDFLMKHFTTSINNTYLLKGVIENAPFFDILETLIEIEKEQVIEDPTQDGDEKIDLDSIISPEMILDNQNLPQKTDPFVFANDQPLRTDSENKVNFKELITQSITAQKSFSFVWDLKKSHNESSHTQSLIYLKPLSEYSKVNKITKKTLDLIKELMKLNTEREYNCGRKKNSPKELLDNNRKVDPLSLLFAFTDQDDYLQSSNTGILSFLLLNFKRDIPSLSYNAVDVYTDNLNQVFKDLTESDFDKIKKHYDLDLLKQFLIEHDDYIKTSQYLHLQKELTKKRSDQSDVLKTIQDLDGFPTAYSILEKEVTDAVIPGGTISSSWFLLDNCDKELTLILNNKNQLLKNNKNFLSLTSLLGFKKENIIPEKTLTTSNKTIGSLLREASLGSDHTILNKNKSNLKQNVVVLTKEDVVSFNKHHQSPSLNHYISTGGRDSLLSDDELLRDQILDFLEFTLPEEVFDNITYLLNSGKSLDDLEIKIQSLLKNFDFRKSIHNYQNRIIEEQQEVKRRKKKGHSVL